MFFKLLKITCKLSGIIYAVERIKMYLRCTVEEGKMTLQAMVQKLAWLVFWVLLLVALLGLGVGFLFYGIAQWFNMLWGSSCLGFFIVSLFCFLGVACLLYVLYRNITQATEVAASTIERMDA
jgi:hypothetical protein